MIRLKLTVVMPVYNAERYLREAVESVLAQDFYDFELVAIDDGSTDSSLRILKSFDDPRIRVISNTTNLGLIASLNIGLQVSRGEYIARMDADDRSKPERFSKQVKFLDDNKEIVLVGTWGEYIDEAGKRFSIIKLPVGSQEIQAELPVINCFIHSSVMFRRDEIIGSGSYSLSAKHAEDYDLWLRLAANYRMSNIPEPLVDYRVHESQVSIKNVRIQRQTVDACRSRALYGLKGSQTFRRLGWWQRAMGVPGSVGNDYRNWRELYLSMGYRSGAQKCTIYAFIFSPFYWILPFYRVLSRYVVRLLGEQKVHTLKLCAAKARASYKRGSHPNG